MRLEGWRRLLWLRTLRLEGRSALSTACGRTPAQRYRSISRRLFRRPSRRRARYPKPTANSPPALGGSFEDLTNFAADRGAVVDDVIEAE